MTTVYEIKIVDRNKPERIVKCASTYKSLEGAKARQQYEQWKYGKAYSVEIWERG